MNADPPRPHHRDAGDAVEGAVTSTSPLSPGELALDALLRESHLMGAHDLPDLVSRHAATLGGQDAMIYLADLQQRLLVPFPPPHPARDEQRAALGVDSTIAGRAFQHLRIQVQSQDSGDTTEARRTRVWLPLLDGTERLGVLAVTVEDASTLDESQGLLRVRLQRFTSLVAELVVAKTLYGDTIVRLRRSSRMSLSAEIQWSLLPPLTFANDAVSVAAGLEPAYDVAGDSVDYAVDADVARFAVFDGMGHGLGSAQLVSLVVAAYRNARRAGLALSQTADRIDTAVAEIFQGEAFSTGLLGELDTITGLFTWISAGHLEPLVLRDGQLVRTLAVEPVLPFGLGRHLAGSPAAALVGSEQLQPGDLLLLYSDGVTEARSPGGDFFGLERLIDIVVRNLAAGLPAPETMRRVVRALLVHQSGDLTDDATVLLVQWHGGPKGLLAV